MTTKRAILSTVGILLCAVVLGLTAVFVFIDMNDKHASERAGLLGQGVASLSLLPMAIVWILWALRLRKDRRS